MKAPGKADGNKVAFAFVGATNMKSDKDMHMHNVTFTFRRQGHAQGRVDALHGRQGGGADGV